MPVRASLLGLAGMILVISGCSTCATCQRSDSGSATVPDSAHKTARLCKAPMWYWSNGRYFSAVDDYLTKQAARNCALRSLNQQAPPHCARDNDFCDGYIRAFTDLARGSRGVIPAVPPPKYWKAHNRSISGHSKANQWFSGYRTGVSHAAYLQSPEQTNVPTSVEQHHGSVSSARNDY